MLERVGSGIAATLPSSACARRARRAGLALARRADRINNDLLLATECGCGDGCTACGYARGLAPVDLRADEAPSSSPSGSGIRTFQRRWQPNPTRRRSQIVCDLNRSAEKRGGVAACTARESTRGGAQRLGLVGSTWPTAMKGNDEMSPNTAKSNGPTQLESASRLPEVGASTLATAGASTACAMSNAVWPGRRPRLPAAYRGRGGAHRGSRCLGWSGVVAADGEVVGDANAAAAKQSGSKVDRRVRADLSTATMVELRARGLSSREIGKRLGAPAAR